MKAQGDKNARTVEITENELNSVTNAMLAFSHQAAEIASNGLEPVTGAKLMDQMNRIQSFLQRAQKAFKENKPVRKAEIFAIDGSRV